MQCWFRWLAASSIPVRFRRRPFPYRCRPGCQILDGPAARHFHFLRTCVAAANATATSRLRQMRQCRTVWFRIPDAVAAGRRAIKFQHRVERTRHRFCGGMSVGNCPAEHVLPDCRKTRFVRQKHSHASSPNHRLATPVLHSPDEFRRNPFRQPGNSGPPEQTFWHVRTVKWRGITSLMIGAVTQTLPILTVSPSQDCLSRFTLGIA